MKARHQDDKLHAMAQQTNIINVTNLAH